ncbi:MAG: HlyD family efflux transporter periplasmic adaptor subunit [Eubacterium sp.]|nr:HlyD family efflux transporter periplasmic adaptor subunit [Eubacterium sp.]
MAKKRRFTINIGTIVFGAIALYLIISLFLYLSADRVTSYMVTYGTLSKNDTFTAMAVRQEQVINADVSGYVSYYISDSDKAVKGAPVCSIADTQNSVTTEDFSSETLSDIRSLASAFSHAYDPSNFRSVYEFQYSMNSSVIRNSDPTAITGTVSNAVTDGIVTYTYDGLEGVTEATIEAGDFSPMSYPSRELRTTGQVQAGSPLYRLITGDEWSVYFPISDSQYASLSSRRIVSVRFAKDGQTENGELSLFDRNGQHFAEVHFYKGMIRYANDRFLSIELVTNTTSGLKIPLSAIVTKEFYTIPVSYLSYGGEDGDAGFLVERKNTEGKTTTEFVSTELYERASAGAQETSEETGEEAETVDDGSNDVYYVGMDDFEKGDVIIQPDSNRTYTIGETATLEGAYCTNKGYTVFRKTVILDQNDEYCIVESGTTYGLSQYDYIVKDGDKVSESQIVTNP